MGSKTELTTLPGLMELSLVMDDCYHDEKSVKNWKEGNLGLQKHITKQAGPCLDEIKVGGGKRSGGPREPQEIESLAPCDRVLLRTAPAQYQKCNRCAVCHLIRIP